MLTQDDQVVMRLAWWEKAATRHRDVRVPLEAVRRVTVEPEWWRALRGVHERGLCIPGALSIGIRCHQAGKDFVAVRRDRQVVCVELRPSAPFRLLAVSARDGNEAEETAEHIARAAPKTDTSVSWRQPVPVPDESEYAAALEYDHRHSHAWHRMRSTLDRLRVRAWSGLRQAAQRPHLAKNSPR
ncbi:hypothetical protein [Streptomyces sp. OE57]|uniref:hypothetical protein n=1 Tax=Streptomyces lacaronensis TaxID=3379885 RepID=UPI0039B774A5